MSDRLIQRGSLATAALVILIGLAAVGIVMSRMYQSSSGASAQNTAGDSAFNLAEAGTQAILSQLRANGCNPAALSGAATSGSDVTVTQTITGKGVFRVTFHPTGGTNTWSVTSAASGNRRVTNFPGLQCGTGGNPGCSYAVVGNTSLSVGNNAEVNDNSVTACGGGSCNVLTSTGALQAHTVNIPALSSFVASSGVNGNITIGNNGSGTYGSGNYGTVTVGNNSTLTFNASGGTYYFNSMTLGNNVTLNLAPGTYSISQLSIGNNLGLVVTPSGVVKVYTQTAAIGNNANINNNGTVANLGIYVYTSLQIGNNADVYGVISAPSGTTSVQLGNNDELDGSIVSGGSVTLGNNTEITYDTAASAAVTSLGVSCAGSSTGGTITAGTWREQF
ncbi:MAG: hypothetical protein HQL66_04340 [Magnetococcales bacterium]|nr:hypothetical protein [Magnetococcales bacterium]